MNDTNQLNLVIILLAVLVIIFLLKIAITAFQRRASGVAQRQVISILIDKGLYEIALRKCNRTLQKRPTDAYFIWLKANILFKQRDYEKAKELFEKLSQEEPLWKEDADKYLSAINEKT